MSTLDIGWEKVGDIRIRDIKFISYNPLTDTISIYKEDDRGNVVGTAYSPRIKIVREIIQKLMAWKTYHYEEEMRDLEKVLEKLDK